MKKDKKIIFIQSNKNLKTITTNDLKNLKNGSSGSRICLHKNNLDVNQEMIIYQTRMKYFPPKKNLITDQTFTIIKGRLLIITFDNFGKINKRVLLDGKKNIICRVSKGVYHCDVPISRFSIHIESNNQSFKNRKIVFLKEKFLGPFISEIKSIQNK